MPRCAQPAQRGRVLVGIDAAVLKVMRNLGLIRSLSIGLLGLGLGIAFYAFMTAPAGWLLAGGVMMAAVGAAGLAVSSAKLRSANWKPG